MSWIKVFCQIAFVLLLATLISAFPQNHEMKSEEDQIAEGSSHHHHHHKVYVKQPVKTIHMHHYKKIPVIKIVKVPVIKEVKVPYPVKVYVKIPYPVIVHKKHEGEHEESDGHHENHHDGHVEHKVETMEGFEHFGGHGFENHGKCIKFCGRVV